MEVGDTLAIFNPFSFNKHKRKDDYTYVSYDDYTLQKSFRNAKSYTRSAVDNLDVGSQTSATGGDIVTKDDILRKKRLLKEYARNIIVQAIIRTRINQVKKLAYPAYLSPEHIGYEVVPKNKIGKKLTNKEIKRGHELENIIYQTGKDYRAWRDTFPDFLAKILYDHFVYDQINVERVFEQARSVNLNHFNAVDASTILINKYPNSADRPRQFVQWIDGKPVNYYSEKELTFTTAWKQTDIHMKGYGFSPVDASLSHIGHLINTEQFNARFFSQGGMVRGLLVINADGTQQDSAAALESIRRSWMPLQGLNGAWKIPMITATDAKFVNMTQNSRDMEFSEWLNYLIKVICADFNIQTEEINIMNKGGATGRNVGSTLNEGNSVKSKMQQSKDTGLIPLLKFIEQFVNDQILRYLDSDYYFRFDLGNAVDEKQRAETIQAKEDAGLTLNEGRKLLGTSPLSGKYAVFGDLPGGPKIVVQLAQILAKTNPDFQEMIQGGFGGSDSGKTKPEDNKNQLEQDQQNSEEAEDSNSDVQDADNNKKL